MSINSLWRLWARYKKHKSSERRRNGTFEWPSGTTSFWCRSADHEDVRIYVGEREGHLLKTEDLESLSEGLEGLAGLCRAAWANGASWLNLTGFGKFIDDVPESGNEDDEENNDEDEEGVS